ncbi:sensor histidine kinase [Paenibacillus glacialis]|uniref:sensor histidine kinase n=1 Tax=Paenibacillus glacialis TaxID=494026 RepID=UPI000838AC70|nr:HAMP domain-containing sensor histidine kinase [Paenibacillus glacialis]
MNKFLWGKLKIKLILSLVFSFAISLGIFYLLQVAGENLLGIYFNKTSFIEKQETQALFEFKSYVSDNGLTLNDQDKITKWVSDKKYVEIYIYKDNNLLYSSNSYISAAENGEYLINPSLIREPFDNIEFADTNAQMYMEFFFEYKYGYIIIFLGVAISFIFFISIMLFFINKKTSYIGILENEIKILEGGNLDYQITIRGNDELSSLAQSINEMRKSFIEKLESEEKARLANSELVTAMSHDLRTPLTALVGYLDIIKYKKYKTDENLMQYIHNSREKAYQIKHLSDKLFEYFTVFNTNEDDLELETFDGNQLIDQIIDEQLLVLQNNGFLFEFTSCDTPFYLEVNLISMRRVFDNIFSNITKYADKSKPVKIKCYIDNQFLLVDINNYINNNLKKVDSTQIGMKTCERIIKKHKGEIVVTRTEDTYSVHIRLSAKTPLQFITGTDQKHRNLFSHNVNLTFIDFGDS